MNCNKSQLTHVNTLPDFNKIFADPTKKIKDVYLFNEEVAAIHWESDKHFVPQDKSTNIFLAAFTTSWARMKLYEEMDKLGESVLYHDTDSIIYSQNGENDPPIGNFLGDFTDELDGDVITTFVSAIEPDDLGLCCAKAIVYATAHLDNNRKLIDVLRRKNRPALLNKAKELHAAAGVPLGPCTFNEVAIFERFLNIQISVTVLENNNKVIHFDLLYLIFIH
ncbi:uncharacterized protein [Parasteatoda tepidariorum]|uniref:uncharacterized protein n=1 Tax=Parasteatoda tepidariorum TaxID=114398 RepID=UPI0039BC4F33